MTSIRKFSRRFSKRYWPSSERQSWKTRGSGKIF